LVQYPDLGRGPAVWWGARDDFTEEDFIEVADVLGLLDPVGEVTLGGDRAAELVLIVERQVNGADGALAVECCLTPSGDDPYPSLRWLIFDVKPFADRTAEQLRRLASTEPWPTPRDRWMLGCERFSDALCTPLSPSRS
jgi:hypothetical protein